MFDHPFCRVLAALASVLLASGCAMQAPRYQPSIDNVEALKATPRSLAVGTFTV